MYITAENLIFRVSVADRFEISPGIDISTIYKSVSDV